MLDLEIYQQTRWFQSLPSDLQELLKLTLVLYRQQKESEEELSDYSFLVFTAGKVYEGFLKYYLLNLGLINQELYESHRFRIGRALNPDVKFSQRDEYWLYDNLANKCSVELAKQVWSAWLECRNQIFHYFPGKVSQLSLLEAKAKIEQIVAAIEAATSCQLQNHAAS